MNGDSSPWFRVPNSILLEWGKTLRADGIAVFAALALHANEEGRCWPSMKRLADLTGLSRRKCIQVVRLLENLALVTVERSPGGQSNRYRLENGARPAPLPNLTVHALHPDGAPPAPLTVHGVRADGAPRAHEQDQGTKPTEPDPGTRPKGRATVPEFPPPLDTPEFREAWERWSRYRRERKATLTPTTQEAQLRKMAEWGQDAAIAAIEKSITNGWQGLFQQDSPQKRSETNGRIARRYQGP